MEKKLVLNDVLPEVLKQDSEVISYIQQEIEKLENEKLETITKDIISLNTYLNANAELNYQLSNAILHRLFDNDEEYKQFMRRKCTEKLEKLLNIANNYKLLNKETSGVKSTKTSLIRLYAELRDNITKIWHDEGGK